jgi:hypothetical protein
VDGSIDTSVSFRRWATVYANFGYAWGLKQFNTTEQFRCGFLGGGQYGGLCPQLFSTDADGERTPEALVKAAASEDFEIGPWVESADFLRLRTLSLRLELPRAWVARVGATNGSFVLSAENLLLFTRYSGLDPEVSFAGGDLTSRAEFFTLPPAKRVTGSLSISF